MYFLHHLIWIGRFFWLLQEGGGEDMFLWPSSASLELSLFSPPPYSVILCAQSPEMQAQSETGSCLYVGPDQDITSWYITSNNNHFYPIWMLKQLLKYCSSISVFCAAILAIFVHPSCSSLHIPSVFSVLFSSLLLSNSGLSLIVHVLLSGLFLLVQRRPWWLHGFGSWPLLGNCRFCISQFYTVKYVLGKQCIAITINVAYCLNLYHAQDILNSVYITALDLDVDHNVSDLNNFH